jgi:hypothetical protein
VLAACAEGKNHPAKAKCQSLVKLSYLIEAILDLEVLDRPEGCLFRHDPDTLRYVRTGLVKLLRHVHVSMTDAK